MKKYVVRRLLLLIPILFGITFLSFAMMRIAGSDVVRIVAEHGSSWGGDAWEWDSDISYGYHDYMHFSYMGG